MARRRRRLLLWLLIFPLVAYLAIVALAWFNQERLLFPAYLAAGARPLPAGTERLTLAAADGTRLEGLHIPATATPRGDTLVLLFAGNATNAQGAAEFIHEIYPDRDVAAFFYRGYRPSGGTAGAEALVEDAPLIHDLVVQRLRPRRVVAVGISLGSGIAAGLAARRPLDGLILVTPFNSLSATARQLHPWLPVRWLLRHDLRSADWLRRSQVPVAIVAAGSDRLVRPERTEALRRALPNLVHDATVRGASHDGIFAHPDFAPAMRAAMAAVEAAAAEP